MRKACYLWHGLSLHLRCENARFSRFNATIENIPHRADLARCNAMQTGKSSEILCTTFHWYHSGCLFLVSTRLSATVAYVCWPLQICNTCVAVWRRSDAVRYDTMRCDAMRCNVTMHPKQQRKVFAIDFCFSFFLSNQILLTLNLTNLLNIFADDFSLLQEFGHRYVAM